MSKRFSLNREDIQKWLINILVFVGPDLIIFLGALASKFSAQDAFGAVLILNIAIDLLRKWLVGKK